MNSNSQELAVNGSGSILELSQISKSDEKSVASKLGQFNSNIHFTINSNTHTLRIRTI